ncbi:MAG: dephospho-CoA kinase [Planctomycetota bacterium]
MPARDTNVSRPLVIGIAGGIGSGKSAAARCFEREGCLISDSDTEAKAALTRPDVKETLVEWWGAAVLDEAGAVDRKAVAGIVFADPEQRERLEALIHPLVHEARAVAIARATEEGLPAVIVDAPLLFEAGIDGECDAVVFVDCPREQRLARVSANRGWSEAELDRREAAQIPVDEKRRRSSHIVSNDGTEEALCEQVARILQELLTRPSANG